MSAAIAIAIAAALWTVLLLAYYLPAPPMSLFSWTVRKVIPMIPAMIGVYLAHRRRRPCPNDPPTEL